MAFDLNPVELGGTRQLSNAFTGAHIKAGARGATLLGSMGIGIGRGIKNSFSPKITNVQQGMTKAPSMSYDMRSNAMFGGNDKLGQALGKMGEL